MPGRRWCVVPNGTGIGAARGERQPGPPRLLFVGRIDPIKALDNLIAALGKLPEAVALTIAGQGDAVYVETLRRQCAAAGVSGQVRFTGFADGAAKAKLYAEADLAITPSHSENFGMVVAEALGHGVPVVVSRGTPWQRVEREGCGLWVGNRPEELAAAVTQALRMDLRAMGERGRAWMEREYSWDGRAKEMLAVYESLRRPVSSTEMDRHA